MLPSRLSLGDLEDVEAVCVRIVQQSLNGSAGHLRRAQYEDAVAYLISETWLMYRRYDPGKAKFATYAYPLLRNRMVDWWRSQLGRNRGAPRPQVVSLWDLDDGELERALAGGPGDDPATGDPDFDGLFASGGVPNGGVDGTPRRRALEVAPRRDTPTRTRRRGAA